MPDLAWVDRIHRLWPACLPTNSLMNEKPYHNEPGFEVARGPRDVENYNDCIGYNNTIQQRTMQGAYTRGAVCA